MKKLYIMMSLGLFAASMTAQAQTTIYSNGFESSEIPSQGKYSSAYALTPGVSIWGDWVNPKDVDAWTEQYNDEAYSGEYCFYAENGENGNPQSWDRGFKIANLPIKENTPYRISYWLKTYTDAKLSSWLSIGIENFDKSFCTPSGTNYGLDQVAINTYGEWKHISFVSYFKDAETIFNYVKVNQNWVGSASFPGEFGGSGESYVDHFDQKFPNEFFFIANMFSDNSSYYLDDIKIEEGVTFNEATFSEDGTVRLNFGYDTNISQLAGANGGFFALDPSCVKVTSGGEEKVVEAVEGKADGNLYIFVEDESFDRELPVVVSFTPSADCPIKYVGEKRPSSDIDAEMQILGFANETAYYDEEIDEVPSSWSNAMCISTIPENNSFDLYKDEIKTVTFTYNKEMSIGSTTATLVWSDNYGIYNKDLSDNITLSEDLKSYIIAMPELEDGDYKVVVTGAENSMGIPSTQDNELSFSVGESTDLEPSEEVWRTDFDNDQTEAIPVGWTTYNEAGYHLYGFNEDGSRYTYHYGGNPGGGGTRLFDGFSGDFNKALYWGTRGTNEGWCTFGAQVADYMDINGNVDPDMPQEISLYLEPKKYQISFLMAAWKGTPTFTFTLENVVKDGEEPNIYARFTDITASPNMNGAKGRVTGAVKCQTDFTVDQEGYYVIRFTSTEAQWQELLLANVNLITMPSKSAYYKNMLRDAADKADEILAMAEGAEYDGDTKSALAAAINSARNDRFTQGSVVEAHVEKLENLGIQMNARIDNLDQYPISVILAQDAIDQLKDSNPDYAQHPQLLEAQESVNSYEALNPSTLSDADLIAAVNALADIATKVNAIPASTNILTWGASQAVALANMLGAYTNGAENLLEDNREVIAVTNFNSKGALYKKIAAGEDLSKYNTSVYDTSETSEEWEDGDPNFDENGHPLKFQGINLSGYIYNAHLYRVLGDDGVPGWTIGLGGGEATEEGETGESVVIGYNATPSKENPVVDAQINVFGGTNYDFSQTIEGLPAGIYNVVIQTRTPKIAGNGVFTDEIIYYNAQDENGTWDKYIYAQGDNDAEVKVTPFAGAPSTTLNTTFIEGVQVKDGKLTMGVHEYYVSGVARTWEPAADATTDATAVWNGTSLVDFANIYFVAPLPGFDYADAIATGIESVAPATSSEIYNVAGSRINNMQKGINIVRYNNGTVQKVLVK